MSQNNRTEEISGAIKAAYANASKLKLTKAEAKLLQMPFSDKTVEIVPQTGAIFIPHIHVSGRLNKVFGPGAWAMICRDYRNEEGSDLLLIEHVLIIRGCFVGESLDQVQVEYGKAGDAIEFAAAKALRKICGKRLSCGSQAWDANYCESWIEKYAETVEINGQIYHRKKGSKIKLDKFSEAPASTSNQPRATEDNRYAMLQILKAHFQECVLMAFGEENNILLSGEPLENWPLDKVPATEAQTIELQSKIQAFVDSKKPKAGWQQYVIPVGTPAVKDKKMGEIAKEDLIELWNLFTDDSAPNIIKRYPEFKEALESAGKEMRFQRMKKVKQ